MDQAKLNKPKKAKYFIFAFFICVFFVGKASAQNNLEILAEQINRGNSEEKRNTLFQIRNLQTNEASRIALPALKDADELVRATAASSVIFLSSSEAVSALSPLLLDKKPFVRKEAAYALGKTRNNSAVRPLLETIQKDKIQEVKDAATVALGEIGETSAVSALTRILQRPLKSNEEFMRRAAARSLGEIANNQVLQRLLKRQNSYNSISDFANELRGNLNKEIPEFKDAAKILITVLQNRNESADVKREAAYALGEIGDVAAIPVLRSKHNSEDYYLAEICKEAIEKINLNSN